MNTPHKPYHWIIAASLAANCLFAGVLIGQFSRHHDDMPPPPPEMAAPADPALAQKFSAIEYAHRNEFKTMDAKRDRLVEILTAPQFDEAAFLAQTKEMDAFFLKSKADFAQRIIAMAKTMTQAERKQLAAYLKNRHPRKDQPEMRERHGQEKEEHGYKGGHD